MLKKVVKYTGGGQEMAVMSDKKFNNSNSGEFVLPHPSFSRNWHKIHLNCRS